jgi:hypothetical protein
VDIGTITSDGVDLAYDPKWGAGTGTFLGPALVARRFDLKPVDSRHRIKVIEAWRSRS